MGWSVTGLDKCQDGQFQLRIYRDDKKALYDREYDDLVNLLSNNNIRAEYDPMINRLIVKLPYGSEEWLKEIVAQFIKQYQSRPLAEVRHFRPRSP